MDIFTLPDPNPLGGRWSESDVVALDNQPNGVSPLRLNTFIALSDDAGRRFLAQQTGLTAQCWRSIDVNDKAAVEILRHRLESPQRTASITEDRVNYHPLTLVGDATDGDLAIVRVRPLPGAEVSVMPSPEVARLLRLPDGEGKFTVGLAGDLPISVDRACLVTHTLVAGTTGSGKTTLLMVLTRGVQGTGGSVIVFDHKPDYSRVGAMEGNLAFLLGRKEDLLPGERLISVPAFGLDRDLLAQTLFNGPTEKMQAECCAIALDVFAGDAEGARWRLADFARWTRDPETKNRLQNVEGLHKATLGAVGRKLLNLNGVRVPPFIDRVVSPIDGQAQETFRFEDVMEPGRVTVVRLAQQMQDSRGYALFLSYLMARHDEYRTHRGLDRFLLVVIDEAQDIFSGRSEFRDAAEFTIRKAVRKARSQNTGVVIAPQSATAVPAQIMGNLNTRFVFRHNTAEDAKSALVQATDAQRELTKQLRPGECMASISNARTVFEVKVDDIDPSWRMTP